jgi:5-methyltetrahydrofolate--homocysteine methyltransferase
MPDSACSSVIRPSYFDRFADQVLVLDGGMGTSIQRYDLTDADFDGLDGCNEILVLTRPDVVSEIHTRFLEAGADILETNTFGATSVVLAEYNIPEKTYDINVAAAKLARDAAQRFSTPEKPRLVAGSIGPTTKLATLGHIDYDTLKASYLTQVEGLLDGGVDFLLVETCQDPLQIKAALSAIQSVTRERQISHIPTMVQVTVELTGTLLVGSDMATIITTLEPYYIDALGMNCATGPKEMETHIRTLSQFSPFPISCVPNAGIPENRGGQAYYHLCPEEMGGYLSRFITQYGVQLIGGCCGTSPEHIAHLVSHVRHLKPAKRSPVVVPQLSSLYTTTPMVMEPAPLLVGERTNANGSKLFKDKLACDDYDALVDIGKEQVRGGAHLLDVCTAYVGRDEVKDMDETLVRLNQQLDVPLMIDTTELNVLESSLKKLGGRAIVNSINLEDGEERLDKVAQLCKEFGAAVVALTIDEQGMAKTVEKKVEVAQRIHDLCVQRHGMRPEDIVFDPLTFTLGSGDSEFREAGIATLEGIRQVKARLPGVKTILGISNISFGLAKRARYILNSVFLHQAVEAGLDMAIVNSAHTLPLHRISDAEKRACHNLIHNTPDAAGGDPLMEFISFFASQNGQLSTKGATESNLPEPLEERLQYRIVDGNKTGLKEDLERALQTYSALDIINTILLEGMKTVGELFGRGEMQLPFVLQSAETMKAAVAVLEPYMEKNEANDSKGVMVLATVKGDVHDIGKNLVDIILTNNGFTVHNLGIKCPVETILERAQAQNADCIAMSGLLVKSTAIMKDNLELMQRDGWQTPVILGGAALTQRFVEEDCQNVYSGPVVYARSAFVSLDTMNQIMDHKSQGKLYRSPAQVRTQAGESLPEEAAFDPHAHGMPAPEPVDPNAEKPAPRSSVTQGLPVPKPPFWGTKIVDVSLEELFPYLNEKVVVTGHWSFRRGTQSPKEHEAFLQAEVYPMLAQMKQDAKENQRLKPQVIYGYFPCQAEGEDLVIFREDQQTEWLRYHFPRGGQKNLCLTDYIRPLGSPEMDVLPMHIVTVGRAASEYGKQLFSADRYTDYFFFHGFAVEMAEALAEYWHKVVREELGIATKEAGKTPKELMRPSSYQGCRYSFGYPACPNLEDQTLLFEMLEPGRIGIELTESFLLDPEQSTSALVFHHPEAFYFDVG